MGHALLTYALICYSSLRVLHELKDERVPTCLIYNCNADLDNIPQLKCLLLYCKLFIGSANAQNSF